jgi:hypothetical protein
LSKSYLSDLARDEAMALEAAAGLAPVGYWALLRDPDGHALELSYGQEVGLTVARHLTTNRPLRVYRPSRSEY